MMIDLRPPTAEKDSARRQGQLRRERLRASAQRLYKEFRKDFEFLETYDRYGGRTDKRIQSN